MDGSPAPSHVRKYSAEGAAGDRGGAPDSPADGAAARSEVPLVLLHGGAFDHADLSWGPLIAPLARDRRVLSLDLPGYGETPPLAGPAGIAELTDWLAAALDDLGLAQVDLAGVSMGGGMALLLALDRPDRVRRLVLVASYGLMGRVPFHRLARRFATSSLRRLFYRAAAASDLLARIGLASAFARPWAAPRAIVAALREVAAVQIGRDSFAAFLAAELTPGGLVGDLRSRLPSLGVPTLLIHGSRDPLVPVRHARAAARAIPNARLLALASGHWPHVEHQARVAAEIRTFLAAR